MNVLFKNIINKILSFQNKRDKSIYDNNYRGKQHVVCLQLRVNVKHKRKSNNKTLATERTDVKCVDTQHKHLRQKCSNRAPTERYS